MQESFDQNFRMLDGFNLSYREWSASNQIERVILCLHGIEAHSGAFQFMGPELAAESAEVYAIDRRGFGKSVEPGFKKGDTSSFGRHLDDLKEVVAIIRERHPGKKIFLFGHSIGCAYALWFGAHYPDLVDGLILAAPPAVPGFKLPAKYNLELPLESVFEPHTMFDLLNYWPQAFKESEEFKLLTQDELCTKDFSANWLVNVQTKLANKMLQNASKIAKPTLVLQGDADIIALPKGATQVMEHLKTQDKQLQTFAGADHWFFHSLIPTATSKYSDEQRRTVSKVIKEWLNAH